eukprot:5443131-Amphidinium_carterae.1
MTGIVVNLDPPKVFKIDAKNTGQKQLSFDADSHVEPYQLLVVHDAKDASEVATLFASIAEAELRTKIADQYEAQEVSSCYGPPSRTLRKELKYIVRSF